MSEKHFLLFRDTIKDYSIIVATRPDPTVRPPSRSSENGKMVIYGLLDVDSGKKLQIFHKVFLFCGNFVAKM